MRRIVGAAAAAILTVTVLAGCGGGGSDGSSGSYCDDLKSTKDIVTSLGSGALDQATFDTLSASVHNIRDEAPSDVKEDWSAVAGGLDAFGAALDDAGLSIDDAKTLSPADAAKLDPAKVKAITDASTALSSTAMNSATDAINTEVKSECGFELGIGG